MFGFGRKKSAPDASRQKDRQVSAPSAGIKGSLMSLEQRLMFDAAASATASEVASEQVAQEQAEAAVSSDSHADGQTAEREESQGLLDAIATYDPGESRTEVVFVDPTVPNYQDLISGMAPNVEIIMLDGGQDGVEQMANALAGRTGVDAIHVISHGEAGALQLGTGILNADSMSTDYADDLAVIQQALSEQADILVYGCEFAQGEAGQAAVDMLAELTGADVQASTDLTGSISLGGDWEFEVSTGTIETSVAISYDTQMHWAEVLGTETVKDTFSTESYSNNNGTQSWSSSWAERDAGGSGASGGDVRVNSGQLRIDTDNVGNAISRGVDLSRATSATLTFNYTNSLVGADRIELRVSTDGGSNYQTISGGLFSNATNTGSGTASFDLSGYMSANTKIQFIVTGTGGGDRLYVDNVQVSYETGPTNSAPTITSNSGGSTASITVAENSTTVTTVTATDANAGQTLTYSISGGADASKFTINSSTGALSFASAPNYESPTDSGGNNVYDVTVQVSDGNGGTDTQAMAVTVANANEAPTDIVQSAGTGIDLNTDGGNNSYLYTTSGGAILGGRTAFSIEAQFSSSTAPVSGEHRVLVSYATTGADNEVRVGIAQTSSSTCQLTLTINGTRVDLSGYDASRLFDGGQHQLGVTWSATNGGYNFYVDGQQVGAGTGLQTGYTTRSTGTLVVGMDQDSVGGSFQTNQVFKGTLQDVRVFNDVRTASEMSAYCTQDVATSESGLVANWTMNNLAEGSTSDVIAGRNLTVGAVSGSGWVASTPSLTWRVAENVSNGTVVGTVTGTDSDAGDTKTYSFTDSAGGRFAINSSSGQITVANSSLLNFESATSHSVTVRVTDSGGLTYDETFTINLTNVNETPTDLALSANSVVENAAAGTVVGMVSGTDPDSSDTKTYSLTDTAGGRFAINASTGQITVANSSLLNYESATSHSVTVRVTDSGGLTYDETFTINLTNVNETPTDLSLSANTVAENAANGTVVGTVSGTDPDSGDTKTYSFTDSAGGRFAINASTGQITVANSSLLNYESATSHSVTVRVTDSGGLTYDETFTINLTNVNEAPTGADATVTISEDTSHSLTTTNFGFSDVDAGNSLSAVRIDTIPTAGILTLSGVAITAGHIVSVADITAGNLVFTPAADANGTGYATLRFSVRDSNNAYDETPNTLTINVTAVNDAPINTVPGNQTVAVDTPLLISGLSVNDVDGDLTTVELAVGNGTMDVTLSGDTKISAGANGTSTITLVGTHADINATLSSLTYQGTKLFSGLDTLKVTSSDVNGVTDTDTVSITVSNNAPTNHVPGPQTVDEDTALEIKGVCVTDADGNLTTVELSVTYGTLTVTLSGGAIISSGGNGSSNLTLSGSQSDINDTLALLTYQGNPDFAGLDTLSIRSTDKTGATDTDTVSITVRPVNDAPTDLALSSSVVAEHATNGTTVGSVTPTDTDSGDTFTYQLTDTAGGRFAINAVTGEITVADGSLLHSEVASSHGVTVRVTDSGGATYDKTFTINLIDVNEVPEDLVLSSNTVVENAANGTVIGTVTGTDFDTGDALTYSFTDSAGGRFAINSSTGQITVADGSLLNYESAMSHSVTVRVTDSGGLTYDETFTINLTNVNETPTDLALSSSVVAEHATNGTTVGSVTPTDTDSGDTFTYQLTDTAGGRFAINAATGEITVADGSLLHSEVASSHDVTVRVTDSGGLTYDKTFTINLIDVNEAPEGLVLSSNAVVENAANGTVIGTVTGTDFDTGDALRYSFTDSAGGRFAINSSTGQITVADGSLLNYESAMSHSVTVRVTDSGGLTYDETFTINLTNVNETPTDLSLSANTIMENASNGTVVGAVSGTDPDAGDTKTYSFTDSAGGRFAIHSSTGQITVADGSLLNYENATNHSVTVRVTDTGGLTYDTTFTINLTNVNETPTDLSLSADTVAENAANGTVVGTVSGTDPDSSDSFTYQLTDTAGGRFSINASTGVITVADGSLLDYENAASHSLTVRVTDSGGLSYDKTFTISLSNEGEAPTSSQDGRGVGPSLIASLPHSVRGLPESSGISASSAGAGQDTRTNDPYWSDDSKNSVKLGSLPAPKMDVLGSDANHHDLGSEDGMHQTGTSNMAENFLNSSSRRDGTTVSRDSADAQRVARLESGQVPRPHTEKAENVSSVGSNGLSMPMLAGLVEVALQGGLGTEDNLGTANTQIRKRNQAASAEKKAQPQPGDEREAPPSAA